MRNSLSQSSPCRRLHVYPNIRAAGGPRRCMVDFPSDVTKDRLYTPQTSIPPCIPSVNAFAYDPPLPGSPPIFLSPMYSDLWANTPRDIMTFAEKDFPNGTTVFPFRTEILEYLKEYGESVRHLVEFHTQVLKVEKLQMWTVTIRDTRDPSKISIRQFDAVAIASGNINKGISYLIPRTLRDALDPCDPGNRVLSDGEDFTCKIFSTSTHLREYERPTGR
jgi:hypothetical protein